MNLIFILIALTAFVTVGSSQTELATAASTSFGTIDSIVIIGNEKTKESVILREMTLKPGMQAVPEALDFDRSRIYSIGLFTSVDLSYVPFEGRNLLIVDVKERWYIIPLPLFGFRDGDPKKPYYGGGVLHNNFRGLNQKLLGSVVFGYNPSLALSFSDPWIDTENNLYFSGGLSFSRIRNKSAIASEATGNFDELHYDINASLGKRFTLYENIGINVGYQIVEVTTPGSARTVAAHGIDRFLYASIGYSFDSRNLRIYPTQGHLISVYVRKYGFGESDVSYTRIGSDVRWFVPLPSDFTLASRVHGSIVSGGVIPTYARSYFGYGERIRGYFKTVFEGENIAGTSLEVRWPLMKPRVIHFTAIDIPKEFAIWQFGITLALFADAGATWFRGDKLSLNSFASGYGGGVVFILPYDLVARAEYAWNDLGKGQLVFDFRASF